MRRSLSLANMKKTGVGRMILIGALLLLRKGFQNVVALGAESAEARCPAYHPRNPVTTKQTADAMTSNGRERASGTTTEVVMSGCLSGFSGSAAALTGTCNTTS